MASPESLWSRTQACIGGKRVGRLIICALAATFAGSALVMKIAPAANLLDSDLSDKMVRQYQEFYEVLNGQLGVVMRPAGNAHGLMFYLAVLHLAATALFILPSGRWSAKVAALWTIITMIGAEYVVSTTEAIPPFVPESLRSLVPPLMHATHIGLILLSTLVWIYGYNSLGLFEIPRSWMAKLLRPSAMEDVCACGAKFWDDALFCTHCGRRRLYVSVNCQTLLVLTFAGSALVMKIGPVFGLVPDWLAAHVLSSYDRFIEVLTWEPAVKKLFDVLMLGTKVNFMLALAVSELLAAALLALPRGVWPARLASVWMIIVMVGAEYCTRRTGAVPPGTPVRYLRDSKLVLSLTHIFVGLMALQVLVCGLPSLRLVHKVRSFWQVKEEDTQTSPSTVEPAEEPSPEASRGRASATGPRKRDSTPVPRAAQDAMPSTVAADGQNKGYKKSGGAQARGAVAAKGT